MILYQSNATTATEMRAEIVTLLKDRYERARRQAEMSVNRETGRPIQGMTTRDVASRKGYAAALLNEYDFWRSVMVEGSVYEPPQAELLLTTEPA